jgi:hypothetical protein
MRITNRRWSDEQLAEMVRLLREEKRQANEVAALLSERWGMPNLTANTVGNAARRYEVRTGTRPALIVRGPQVPRHAFEPRPGTYTASNGVTLAARVML